MKKQRPSKAKATEMLHNPPGGKFASDKQRRYFAWLANKQEGGPVVDPNGYLESNAANFQDQMIIPGGNITTDGMAFPITANGQPLYPNTGDYQFDTPYVVEQPMFQEGGSKLSRLPSGVRGPAPTLQGLNPNMFLNGRVPEFEVEPKIPFGWSAYRNNYNAARIAIEQNDDPSNSYLRAHTNQAEYQSSGRRKYSSAAAGEGREIQDYYKIKLKALQDAKTGKFNPPQFQLGGQHPETMMANDPRINRGQNYNKQDWGMYDQASYFVEQGSNPLQSKDGLGQAFVSQYGQQGRDVITGVSIFNQDPANQGLSPEARLKKFYGQSNSNPEVERLRMMGVNTTDPYGAYKRSNNVLSNGQYIDKSITKVLTVGGKFRN